VRLGDDQLADVYVPTAALTRRSISIRCRTLYLTNAPIVATTRSCSAPRKPIVVVHSAS